MIFNPTQDNVEQVVDEREKELQMLFTEKEREMRETQEMVAHKLAQTEQRAATTQQVIIEKYGHYPK